MKLTDDWFTSLAEDENGNMMFVNGRDNIMNFIQSAKFKERVEITWKYEPDVKGLPNIELGKLMEEVQFAIQKAMEKDKLSIMTGVYIGNSEKVMVFITRNIPAFGERLNLALKDFELLPITIYSEKDPENEEYLDMYRMKENAIE